MEQTWNQICIVAWKHYKIRKRHIIITSLEVAVPVAIFILVAYARSNLPSATKEYVPETVMDPISDKMLSTTINTRDTRLLYSPRTNFTYTIIRKVQIKLSMYNEAIIGFDNKESLTKYYKENVDEGITVVVSFDGDDNNLSSKLNYDLQIFDPTVDWQTNRLYRNDISYIPGAGSHLYLGNQFIAFQWAVDTSFIELITKVPFNVSMTFTEFPYPSHWTDDTNNKFLNLLPLLTILSFIFLFPSILKIIVSEKTSGMKQLMKMNGLKSWAYWFGWYLNAFSLCCISGVTIAILLTHKIFHEEYAPLQHANVVQLVLLLFLFCSATITFIFAFSIIFKQATLAMILGIMVFIISYDILVRFANNIEIIPLYVKVIASFLPHMALSYGFEIITIGEIRGRTVGFTEAPRGSTSDDMTMMTVLFMLVMDTSLYLLITVLWETNSLGKHKLYKLCNKIKKTTLKDHEKEVSDNLLNGIEVCDDAPLLEIKNLTKNYDGIMAVNNLSLTIYEGDLMVLLGHNAAGKTTFLSILAGLLKETSGDIILSDAQKVNLIDRQFVSICPQENMLFSELSVEEHLEFFGKLKGIKSAKVKEGIEDLLKNKLQLYGKRHELPINLSGGMKRKLCLAIALMGKPKLVLLDEPTAGIDIEGRRDVWDMILSCKDESTFIVSTHLMEEAETLANRVAIMAQGELICYGTPTFLMNHYNVGYRIQLECASQEELLEIDTYFNTELGECFKLWINTENSLIGEYRIQNNQQSKLLRLLEKLEDFKKCTIVRSYNISCESFEDIFLQSLKCKRQCQNEQLTKQYGTRNISDVQPNMMETQRETDFNSSENQFENQLSITFYDELYEKFVLIFQKKLNFIKKTGTTWFIMIVVFYLLLYLTFALSDGGYSYGTKGGKTIMLNLKTYGNTKVPYNMYSNKRLANIFEGYVIESSSTPCPANNISTLLLSEAVKNIVEYNRKYVAGLEVIFAENNNEVNVLYSNQAIHGAPISLNLATNTILKYMSGNLSHTITASHTPLRATKIAKHQTNISLADNVLLWTIVLPVGCLFSVVMFTSLTTLERKDLIITLSRIYKFPPYLYWVINYVIDVCTYIIIISLPLFVLGFLSILNIIMLNMENVGYFVVTFVWYGIVIIPYGYIITFWVESAASVFAQFLLPNMYLSPVITGVILSLQMADSWFGNTLLWIFTAFNPHIILTYTMAVFCMKMVKNHNWDILPDEQKQFLCYDMLQYPCCDSQSIECRNERSYNQHSEHLVFCVVASHLLLLLIIIMDSSHNSKHYNSIIVQITNIKKTYRVFRKWIFKIEYIKAVQNLSFTVSKGEVFGLLGVNGAGKSTSFRLITGQEKPDGGSIGISDKIGYCPQDNVLIKCFTGKELLTYFGKMRNFYIRDEEIDELLCKAGLYEYRNQPCGTYSGGNKRKLNMCIALIGNPDVVVLDEPTTGVDPENRKRLRNLLMEIKLQKSAALILSSHSMDDCEKLCDKLRIMKKGELQTGEHLSVSKLKEKYNVGHIVQIQTNGNCNIDSLLNAVKERFADIETLTERNASLSVRIINYNWKEVLEKFEEIKCWQTGIWNYTVKQSSLEYVFLQIARNVN